MDTSKRPGGLTALAIINFVFAGLIALSTGFILLIGPIVEMVGIENFEEKDRASIESLANPDGLVLFLLALSVIVAVLLILSGIGYLKCKKFMGRTLGNTYAVVTIIYNILWILMPPTLNGGFNLSTIIGLIYPIVTLVLLNKTFKDNLVN